METFSALMALCAGNSPVTGEFPTQMPVTRNFDISLICAWISGWVNNGKAGNLRRHCAHYDVNVMKGANDQCGAEDEVHGSCSIMRLNWNIHSFFHCDDFICHCYLIIATSAGSGMGIAGLNMQSWKQYAWLCNWSQRIQQYYNIDITKKKSSLSPLTRQL